MQPPLIELRGLSRSFSHGDQQVTVLQPLDLTIHAGEMVAIVGTSGSGKSTLMNLLGCLDRPSSGHYFFRGQDTAALDALGLADLRCHHFGFIFQRYHLLPHLDACANVEIPAIYAGQARQPRRERAMQLLSRLGLADRMHHQPGQLSGGQQQRVSIARALMNGAEVILADEPTGALDSQSGQEVLAILKELHQLGHTVILVTHDPAIAAHAERIIELKDGRVIRDSASQPANLPTHNPLRELPAEDITQSISAVQSKKPELTPDTTAARRSNNTLDRLQEAFRMAWHAMRAHRMRTFLTMLGIIIGITAVVSVVALGQGARQKVIDDINAMGTNTIDIFPGKGWGDENASAIRTLNERDLRVLQEQPYLSGASPKITSAAQVRWRNKSLSGSLSGVSPTFFSVTGLKLVQGRLFNAQDLSQQAAVAVIEEKSVRSLFGKTDPVGQVVVTGNMPLQIIGVVREENRWGGTGNTLSLWIPYTSMMSRVMTQSYFSQITLRVRDGVSPPLAEQAVTELLTRRHGSKDFFTYSSDTILTSVKKTTATMTLLVSAIAVISLIVGGVGVMNIMLVSVVERTREIGIRIAVGARQSDILQQFMIEAVMISLVGGLIGVVLSLGIGVIFSLLVSSMKMQFSLLSLFMAFSSATLIGVIFGYLPARNAARLDPVDALVRE
ncbi:macrolide ABC transporter permease/ATP-binding protein MacB [Plesiomonas shigelloides]|uniref:MacB family efflux pump subunit n=1 Tax=Plesiomonas shigelloides TaxID=703 RepID=UPI000D56991D|nr:MacB family efflux pump subunit [Plesiomonas shigelloides]PVU65820.1 macrolide ABC transporter permease/ATP-binding protein MacB [Plesiomonas shigelloides]HAD42660.1 macrolide ABC transporter permease/ATP-binding protein MacB [Plesiomonas shigelloides]